MLLPFTIELVSSEANGCIYAGDTIRVIGMNEIFYGYGVLLSVKEDRKTQKIPLDDLMVKDIQTPQYQMIKDCSVLFSNW